MIISDARLQKALTFLAETDEECGLRRGRMEGASLYLKTMKSAAMLDSKMKTQGDREADAYQNNDYLAAVERYQNAVADYESMRCKRATETLVVEVWRSQNANRRQGNI